MNPVSDLNLCHLPSLSVTGQIVIIFPSRSRSLRHSSSLHSLTQTHRELQPLRSNWHKYPGNSPGKPLIRPTVLIPQHSHLLGKSLIRPTMLPQRSHLLGKSLVRRTMLPQRFHHSFPTLFHPRLNNNSKEQRLTLPDRFIPPALPSSPSSFKAKTARQSAQWAMIPVNLPSIAISAPNLPSPRLAPQPKKSWMPVWTSKTD